MEDWPASEAIRISADKVGELVAGIASHLAKENSDGGRVSVDLLDRDQPAIYDFAFLASESRALALVANAVEAPKLTEDLALRAAADLLRSIRHRAGGHPTAFGSAVDVLDTGLVLSIIERGSSDDTAKRVLDEARSLGSIGLTDDLIFAASEFRRFGEHVIAPIAGEIHAGDLDIPDAVLEGLSNIGAFGLSIPVEYGGSQDESADHRAMVVATEELSRVSLGVGGSLITRPEILAKALLEGGTDAQLRRWLPGIASGEHLVAVATTEPDAGSDVAAIRTSATKHGDHFSIRGTKTWATFSGRADLLMLLARTDPTPESRHRGLSVFVVEKERCLGHEFELVQPGGGRMLGRAIRTIGYRGMHSFEVVFDDWLVPSNNLIGEQSGFGRGFELQASAFSAGRLQTAARAIGLMRASFECALEYAQNRPAFGKDLIDFTLTRSRLASMAARIATMKLFAHKSAEELTTITGQMEASMVKALSCRAAEEISRDALQIFGSYGYAEEYPISRFFVDARVLSIFEGTEEVLALRVIARRLLESSLAEIETPLASFRRGDRMIDAT